MKKIIVLAIALISAFRAFAAGADATLDVARTIWDEARGESSAGRRAVASVIWNRSKGNPEKFSATVRKPYQFSGWNNGKTPDVIVRTKAEMKIWNECKAIAKEMSAGSFKPTTNADHYFSTTMKKQPRWASKMKFLKQIGKHRFYKA